MFPGTMKVVPGFLLEKKGIIMAQTIRKYEMDMCNGPLLGKILVFSLPLMLSGILQLLFNAADMIVVGKCVGSDALAAVGSTGSLVNLIVNVFIGLSVGTNVLVARYYGAGQEKELSDTVHTAITSAIVCGIFLIFVGFFVSPFALELMGSPGEVLGQSVLYLRIYFAGMPAMMVYNFGSAVLRAVGDTKRPLYFLSIAGVINVILNLFFVIVCRMGVAGVGLATTISQFVSAALVVICLMKTETAYKLSLNKLKIYKHKLLLIIRIGVPAGLQGAIFSMSNVLIQSSINSFGADAMAANSAAGNLEGFAYTAMNTFHQSAVSFTSQNFGARKYNRIGKIMLYCVLCVTVVGLVMGNGLYFLGRPLLGLYVKEAEVIEIGLIRLLWISCPYFLCGLMDTIVGVLRGMGYAIMPMIVSLTGACLLRVIWIYTVFAADHRLEVLYFSYPFTWTVTLTIHLLCFFVVYKKLRKKV